MVARNWAAEATAIASGESQRLPEREHLQALAAHAEQVIRHSMKLGEIVLALMLDNGVQQLPIPGGILHSVRARRLSLEIHPVMRDDGGPVADGSIVLTAVTGPTAETPTTGGVPPPKSRVH